MKKISIMFLLLSLSVLVSCNSGGGSSPVSAPVNPTSDLSGTVSSVLNFMNPISSAHAASEICTTPGGSNKGVQIYLVDKGGNEKIICYANLNSNGSFNSKIRKDLIPSDSQLKIKAEVAGGAIREAFVNTGSLGAVSVDPASTLAVPVIQDQWVKGNDFDAKEIRKSVDAFVKRCIGKNASEMTADKIASLKYMIKNSSEAMENAIFKDAHDSSFDLFVENVYNTKMWLGENGEPSRGGHLSYSPESAAALEKNILEDLHKKVKK
jgi:hypothetical protein